MKIDDKIPQYIIDMIPIDKRTPETINWWYSTPLIQAYIRETRNEKSPIRNG